MCVGQTEPDMESCNGEDDDCDGVVDNLIRSCGVGACQRMMLACVLGREVTCVQGMPSTEVCNNIDDDCDGMVDEDLTRPCFSAPTSYLDAGVPLGTQRCSMGLWSACMGEVYPQVEVCNGMDDDCDGVVDNMCRDR
ncbi:MAG: MopE-related protein [Polyangiales bacterium]